MLSIACTLVLPRAFARWGALAVMLASLCVGIAAQGLTGQISGVITDSGGAAIPNAKITITNEETARVVSITADSEGNFFAPPLLSGTYLLAVEASGFKRFEQKGILLAANDKLALRRIVLEVGDVSQTVTVTAEAALVKTESAERAGLIDEQQIEIGRAHV